MQRFRVAAVTILIQKMARERSQKSTHRGAEANPGDVTSTLLPLDRRREIWNRRVHAG